MLCFIFLMIIIPPLYNILFPSLFKQYLLPPCPAQHELLPSSSCLTPFSLSIQFQSVVSLTQSLLLCPHKCYYAYPFPTWFVPLKWYPLIPSYYTGGFQNLLRFQSLSLPLFFGSSSLPALSEHVTFCHSHSHLYFSYPYFYFSLLICFRSDFDSHCQLFS